MNNKYTINHYNYNKLGLVLIVKFCGLIIFGYTSQSNFGLKFKYICMEYTFYANLFVLRFAAAIYMLVVMPYEFVKLIGMTVTINNYNWWQNKKDEKPENFLTNVSLWNAFVCWIGWFFMYFVILVLAMMTLVMFINTIKLITRHGCWFALKKICQIIYVSLKTFCI